MSAGDVLHERGFQVAVGPRQIVGLALPGLRVVAGPVTGAVMPSRLEEDAGLQAPDPRLDGPIVARKLRRQ